MKVKFKFSVHDVISYSSQFIQTQLKRKEKNSPSHIIATQSVVYLHIKIRYKMEASKPKWVNPVLNIIGVNSLRLEGLPIFWLLSINNFCYCTYLFSGVRYSCNRRRIRKYWWHVLNVRYNNWHFDTGNISSINNFICISILWRKNIYQNQIILDLT